MPPEEKARQQIDRQLGQCGWIVQSQSEMNITAGTGVAIREFPLQTGFADYLLYAGGKVIGVVEAKPEGHTLTGVETQSAKYSDGLPDGLPHHRLPLPFAYESTGTVTQFTNNLEPDARSREVFTFHNVQHLRRNTIDPASRVCITTIQRLYSMLKGEEDYDFTYTGNQLDRDVVSEPQIRLIVQTFRDRLPTEIFPGRKGVPKTLVFAKNDLHADDIVKIIREEFGKGNEFCQKITSKSTGKKPEELLADFRNSYFPRIAVTVDMIATSTDVKPLECLLFMRNINSWSYFEQMKGRGSRVIKSDDLQSVTPDAKHKTHFVIVDAVGVCERDKTASKPLDRKPSVPLDKLLKAVAAGMVNDDVVSTLVARLSRLELEIDDQQDHEIAAQAGGKSLATLCHELLDSIDSRSAPSAQPSRSGSICGWPNRKRRARHSRPSSGDGSSRSKTTSPTA